MPRRAVLPRHNAACCLVSTARMRAPAEQVCVAAQQLGHCRLQVVCLAGKHRSSKCGNCYKPQGQCRSHLQDVVLLHSGCDLWHEDVCCSNKQTSKYEAGIVIACVMVLIPHAPLQYGAQQLHHTAPTSEVAAGLTIDAGQGRHDQLYWEQAEPCQGVGVDSPAVRPQCCQGMHVQVT